MGITEISAGRFAEIALALDKNPYAPSMRVETMSTIATLLFDVIALTRLPCEHSPVMMSGQTAAELRSAAVALTKTYVPPCRPPPWALDMVGEAILTRVNGTDTLDQIITDLAATFQAPRGQIAGDVQTFLQALRARVFLRVHP